jgi:hypothetical protein
MEHSDTWIEKAEKLVTAFEAKHGLTYRCTKREVYASFEIGCLVALLAFYHGSGFATEIRGLQKDDGGGPDYFRYHTTPSGNPDNFSWVSLTKEGESFQVRQQMRIQSHLDADIHFTPDIVVLRAQTEFSDDTDRDYANGKRRLFCVASQDVVAAHECKSMQPFPELLVSFLGMLVAAHPWVSPGLPTDSGPHLAPTLFVGGTAKGLHRRMVAAMSRVYPMNAILGLHEGTWDLSRIQELRRIPSSPGVALS